MFSFLVFLLFLTQAYAENRYAYLLPNSTGAHKWERIEPADLMCPIYNNVALTLSEQEEMVEVTVYVPSGYRDKLIEGHICQKIRATATCHEHWFTGRDLVHETKQTPVSLEECLQEIEKPEAVFSVLPPTPDCSYFQDLSAVNDLVSISKMDIHYDPYRDSYVSPVLVGGLCRSSPCRASFGRSLWIPNQKGDTTCQLEKRSVWVERTSEGSIYHSAMHPPKSDPVCRMNFCGKQGMKFDDGEWFYIPELDDWTSNLTVCQDTTVSSYSAASEMDEIDYVEDLMKASRCYDTISRIRATAAISPWDLSIFSPDRPGLSYGYRLNNGILERSLLHYVISATRELNGTIIGSDLAGSKIYWDDWIAEGPANQTWHGPNGLLITKTKGGSVSMLLPHESIRMNKLNRAYSKPAKIIDHFESPTEELTVDQHDLRFKSYTFATKAYGWTHDVLHSQITWLIVGLILLYPIIKKTILFLLFGNPSTGRSGYFGAYKPEEVEMHLGSTLV